LILLYESKWKGMEYIQLIKKVSYY